LKPARGTDPLLRRPFSIFEVLRHADGTPEGITILNKRTGVGTSLLYHAERGATVSCLGPLGRPFEAVAPPTEAWMIAGGVGLAPFVTLATRLHELATPTTLFYGARTAAELYYVELFEKLGVHTVLSTEDGSRGTHGRVTAPLEAALASLTDIAASLPQTHNRAAPRGHTNDVRLYVCGPTPMMHAVARLAGKYRKRCDVSLEQVMGCGMGGCYSCVVPTKEPGHAPHFVRSCIEGPVFDASRIVWEGLK
jgi:dihydroorotate dehydrogenase electron transfer subunit